MRHLLYILTGFILLLGLASYFPAKVAEEPEPYIHPIMEEHPDAVRVPAYHGKSTLFVCGDSVATFYGHRPMDDWEREAYETFMKPEGQ